MIKKPRGRRQSSKITTLNIIMNHFENEIDLDPIPNFLKEIISYSSTKYPNPLSLNSYLLYDLITLGHPRTRKVSKTDTAEKSRFINGNTSKDKKLLELFIEDSTTIHVAGRNLFQLVENLDAARNTNISRKILEALTSKGLIDGSSSDYRELSRRIKKGNFEQFYITLLSITFAHQLPTEGIIFIEHLRETGIKAKYAEEYIEFCLRYGLASSQSAVMLYHKVIREESENCLLNCEMGNLFYSGEYFNKPDYEQAFTCFKKSSGNGYLLANWALGQMFENYRLPENIKANYSNIELVKEAKNTIRKLARIAPRL